MAMTVKRAKEKKGSNVFLHKIADIPGGVSISTKGNTSGVINEGTIINKPVDGVATIYDEGGEGQSPFAIVGTTVTFIAGDNAITDAWTHALVQGCEEIDSIKAKNASHLTGIINL